MMHHTFLYFALLMCLIVYVSSYLKWVILAIGLLYALYHYRKKVLIHCFVVIVFTSLSMFSIDYEMQSHVLQIVDLRTNYVIASDGKNKCILYDVNDVELMDVIFVKGKFEEIYSQKNRDTFQFCKYMKRKGITYSMNVKGFKVLHKSRNLKAKMYHFISNKEAKLRNLLMELFYRYQDESMNDIIFASGMHLNYVSYCLSKMLKKEKSKTDIILSFIYFLLFPSSTSIICIFIFALVKEFFNKLSSDDHLGLSIILLLLFDRSFAYEISFQLMVLFRLVFLFDRINLPSKIKTCLLLFPFQLFHFHICYPVELLFFNLYRNMSGIYFIFAILSLFCSVFTIPLKVLHSFMMKYDIWIKSTFSIIGKPYLWWLILWILLFIQLLSRVKKDYYFIFLFLLFIQINLVSFNPLGEVTFLDVGQGDAILIREPFNGEVMMIDVAGKLNHNLVEKRIFPYLQMEGIKSIDKVIITHDDYDHSGGLKELQELIPIKTIIKEKQDKIRTKKLCFYNLNKQNSEDENDNSLVLYTKIGTLDYLFMADASIKVEKEIMHKYNKLNADILKVGHHGSNTSSDLMFIKQIHPLLSVVSSGKDNYYGHPHIEVIERLKRCDSYILNTQEDGSITIFFTSFLNFLRTGNNEFAIIK